MTPIINLETKLFKLFSGKPKPSASAAPEARAGGSPENPNVPLSSVDLYSFFGMADFGVAAGVRVTEESALGVPAIFAARNLLSSTLAGLPLAVFERTDEGRKKVEGSIAALFADAVNDELTSFNWRKQGFDQVFGEGRAYTYIERDAKGDPVNFYPLETSKTTPIRRGGKRIYLYREGGRTTEYEAKDVIDIAFMLKPDGVRHYSPIRLNKEVIGMAIAVTRYGARFFNNGGVPPFSIEGPIKTAGGVDRAGRDISKAVEEAASQGRPGIAMPEGHKLVPLGFDPSKMQMVEVKRFLIEEIARIYSMPPVFLQDLTHGTFSNTEQQDLHYVKHTLKRWVEQFEQEVNLKVFGRGNRKYYVRFNLDGLLRGDFKTRMEGYAVGIQNGMLKPNEARALEEREADPDGAFLMIQGGTVPIKNQLATPKAETKPDPKPAPEPEQKAA